MSRLLADTRTATLGASTEAAQRRGLFHVDLLNEQFIHVSAVVVFGVGDRGFERLEDDAGSALLRKAQDVEGLVHGLTANQVGHQTALLSRKANAANDCSSFHLITP